MLTSLAVILVGIWLILHAVATTSKELTLVFGIVVGVLALIDLIRGHVTIP